jgi:hypothetical protein
MKEFKFKVKFVDNAKFYPKPAPSIEDRTKIGTATVLSESEKEAVADAKYQYKLLGLKILDISLT